MIEVLYSGVVRAEKMDNQWAFVRWTDPGNRKLEALKDLMKIEMIIKNRGLRGWVASSEKDHVGMHDVLRKLKAKQFSSDEKNFHFMKEVI